MGNPAHTAWAYCHVPNNWRGDATAAIEQQIERFAPGFTNHILARHIMGTAALEAWTPTSSAAMSAAVP